MTAWVVDTCLLIDILEDDPEFGLSSATLLDSMAEDGLVLCPVSYTELAPAFDGNQELQKEFLEGIGIDWYQDWTWSDTLRAHATWNELIRKRRAQKLRKRPQADILIGAFAARYQGLLTRNPGDFATAFPDLVLRLPAVGTED